MTAKQEQECKVPGCRAQSKDERGYCEDHLWILPLSRRTQAEVLDLCEHELANHWSSAIPFLSGSSRGDLDLPLDWITDRIADVERAREILDGVLRQTSRRRVPSQMRLRLSQDLEKAVETNLTKLTQILREGGELRKYASSPESWANMCGRAGLAIVKDGKVLWTCVTMMN